jgi:hypothetical protein
MTADGEATELWLAVLRRRLPADDYAAVAPLRLPPSGSDRAWERLIRARAPEWERRHMDELAPLFPSVAPPRDAVRLPLGP